MAVTYFKRFRMEFDLRAPLFDAPEPPAGYELLAWRPSLCEAHADVKFRSFRFEIDANVFSCFGDLQGCRRLMREIIQRPGFLPEATWLARHHVQPGARGDDCGTIQGVEDAPGVGSVQNVGVTPEHRGRKIGAWLLHHALVGFREHGLRKASLEVTAQNTGALRLYQRLGFRTVRTVYKAVEVAYA